MQGVVFPFPLRFFLAWCLGAKRNLPLHTLTFVRTKLDNGVSTELLLRVQAAPHSRSSKDVHV